MSSTRRISIAAGALFIVATVAAVAAATLLPALTGPNYLMGVANHAHQVTAAAILYLIAAGSSVGIAIALCPVLKEFDAALALGSVVFRTVEAVFYTAAVVSLLSILTLGQEIATAPAADRSAYRAVGASLLATREHASLAGVFAFSTAAFMYYVVFYRARIVPRWLSGFGIVAVLAMVTGCLLALFSNGDVTGYKALVAPIFVQEMVFAVWLLVKGFSPSPLSPTKLSAGPATMPTISETTASPRDQSSGSSALHRCTAVGGGDLIHLSVAPSSVGLHRGSSSATRPTERGPSGGSGFRGLAS